MAKTVQWRGGTAAEHASFTGAAREVTVETDTGALRVHDGVTVGGKRIATEAEVDQKLDTQTHTIEQVEGLQEALDGKVALTGDQTIAGAKTFTGSVTVPTPTADGHAATKAYVDGMQDDTAASILAAFQQFNSENGIE